MRRAIRITTWIAIPAALIAAWVARGHLPSERTRLMGCLVVNTNGACETNSSKQAEFGPGGLRIWIDAPAHARIALREGLQSIRMTEVRTPEGRLFDVTPTSGRHRLLITIVDGLSLNWAMLEVSDWQAPGWLKDAREKYLADDNDAVASLLDQKASHPISASERAQALSLLARLAFDAGDTDKAEPALRRAIQAARDAGLVSEVARDTTRLGNLLGHQLHRFDEAATLFAENLPSDAIPEETVWRSLQRSDADYQVGNFHAALSSLQTPPLWLERFQSPWQTAEWRMARATVLQAVGRLREAQRELDAINDAVLTRWRRANVITQRAQLALTRARIAPNDQPQLELQAAFRDAEKVHREAGENARLAEDYVLEGEAHLLYGRLQDARDCGTRAHDFASRSSPAALTLPLLELDGEIALTANDFAGAAKHFEALRSAAIAAGSADDLFGVMWTAWFGIARAAEALGREDEALHAYREMEKYLEQRSDDVPLGSGRTGFFGMHERGTVAFVDFLSRKGLLAEAMLVVRNARVRGLRAYRAITSRALLTDAERREQEKTWAELRKLRVEHDLRAEEAAQAAEGPARDDLQRRAAELRAKLDAAFERAFGAGAAKAIEPRSPRSGETLLTCHPKRAGWLCIAQNASSIGAATLSILDEKSLTVALADMQSDFARIIRSAVRLTVIPYGAMRQLALDAVPIDGQALGERTILSYALDLPTVGTPPRGARSALVLFDPFGSLAESRAAAEDVTSQLRAHALDVVERVQSQTLYGSWPGRRASAPEPLVEGEFARRLSESQLFVFFGHQRPPSTQVPAHGPTLVVDDEGLTATDILMLPRTPRGVVLVACEAARSDAELGGLEGMGVAQAFLLRGTEWLIAPVRAVRSASGAALASELFARGIDREDADRAAILREARRAVRAKTTLPAGVTRAELEADVDAFRVYGN